MKLKGEEGAHGRVWGVLYWRNQRVSAAPTRVRGASKRVWRWLPPDAERARLAPLAGEMRRLEREAGQAAEAGGGGGSGGQ